MADSGVKRTTVREVNEGLNEFKDEMTMKVSSIDGTLVQLQTQVQEQQIVMAQILSTLKCIEKGKSTSQDIGKASHSRSTTLPGAEVSTHNSPISLSTHIPKLYFPTFDGSNPRAWVQKSLLFYKFQPTEESVKVDFAVMHFEGRLRFGIKLT